MLARIQCWSLTYVFCGKEGDLKEGDKRWVK